MMEWPSYDSALLNTDLNFVMKKFELDENEFKK